MRHAGACIAVLLVAMAPAAAAQSKRYAGSIAVGYSLTPTVSGGTATGAPGDGFTASYAVAGTRSKASYLLTGHGTERLNAAGRYDLSHGTITRTVTFSATAAGTVRLLRKPRGPAQTSGLVLRLRPNGRFTLSLLSLEGFEGGLPLTYVSDDDSTVPCDGGGVEEFRKTYDSGLFTIRTPSVCPGDTPEDKREGAKAPQTIWGETVWTTKGLGGLPKPDVCRGRVAPLPHASICGRVGSGGRIRGHETIGPYPLDTACPFNPLTTEGIVPGPVTAPDGVFYPLADGCAASEPGWRAELTVRWNLRPA
jgi:hypothetical protein